MNISSTTQTEKINETNSTNTNAFNENEEKTSFSEEYKILLAQNGISLGITDQNLLASIMNDSKSEKENFLSYANSLSSIRSSFNYDTLTISKEDALFFNDLVEKTDYVIGKSGEAATFQLNLLKVANDSETQNPKQATVSKALMNLIEEAYQTQKPTRIDFDNNISVILKINKEGKVSAEFIPSDKAVEQYLRNNIGYLKERLNEQNIDYGDILYKPYKDNSKKQRNNQNGGQK